MRPKLTRLFAFALFASSSSSALAQALEWRVSETSGPVSLVNGDQKRAVMRGMKLQPGDAVHAGPGGRAVLVQGRDFVTVSANSRVSVPTADKATGYVKLLQDWGQALFKIEKKGTPHFGVNTPSLAAVVKGTTFSITVDRSGSSLQVTEGAVEVATLDGGARDLLRPGGLASIAAADPYRLNVRADDVRVLDSPARGKADTGAAAPEPTVMPTTPSVEVSVETPADTTVTIDMGVSSAPADLSQVTGGLIAGTAAPVQLAAITATVRAAAFEAPAPVETPPPAAPPPAAPSDSSSQPPPATGNQASAPAQPSPPADPGNGNGNGNGQGNGNAGGNGQGGGNAPADPGQGNGGSGSVGNGNAGGNGNGSAGPGSEAGNGGNGEGKPGPGDDDGKDKPGKDDDDGRDDDDDAGKGKPGKGGGDDDDDEDDRPGKGANDDDDDDEDDDDDRPGKGGKDDDDDDDDDDDKKGDSLRRSASTADAQDVSASTQKLSLVNPADRLETSIEQDRVSFRNLRDGSSAERPR